MSPESEPIDRDWVALAPSLPEFPPEMLPMADIEKFRLLAPRLIATALLLFLGAGAIGALVGAAMLAAVAAVRLIAPVQ